MEPDLYRLPVYEASRPLSGPVTRSFGNKCSVAAEMGDRARAKWTEKWGRLLCSLIRLDPHLAQCGLGRGPPPYQLTKWHLDSFNRLATMLQSYRQDKQRSDSIGRTVLQTVRPKNHSGSSRSSECKSTHLAKTSK